MNCANLFRKAAVCLVTLFVPIFLIPQFVYAEAPLLLEHELTPVAELSPIQLQAIDFLLYDNDTLMFIKKNIPPGKNIPQTDANADEFGESATVNPYELENKKALEDARQILAGERDVPLSFDLRLVHYFSDEESFKTGLISDAVRVKRARDIYLTLSSGERVQIHFLTYVRLASMTLVNTKQFSALKLQKDLAKKLLEILGQNRTLRLTFRCRVVPHSQTREQVPGYSVYAADVKVRAISYDVKAVKDFSSDGIVELPDEIRRASTFVGYERTKADSGFSDQYCDKLLSNGRNSYIFKKDGGVVHGEIFYNQVPAGVLSDIASLEYIGKWYVSKNKVVIVSNSGATVLTTAPIDGGVRLDDFPFYQNKSFIVENGDISYRPKK